jgi:hypothetical protein
MVHHIDGNKMNDTISNFYIFRNMGLHLNFEILLKYKILERNVLKSNLKEFKEKNDNSIN